MVKRIPMILFILTILSFVYMIIIRLNAMGTKLLTTGSKAGKFIAANYHSSVILFVVILAAFVASVLIANSVKSRRKEQAAEDSFES